MTKPSLLKLDLQLFAEGDPAEPAEPVTPNEPVKPTEPPAEPNEPPQDDSFLEIQYNKEQLKLDKERAKELAQKGMNYDKAVERAKQEARDAYIAEQNYEWNGKPIKTEAEYKQAVMEKNLMDKYKAQDLPDDVIQELIESKSFREKYNADQKQAEEKAEYDAQFEAFLSAFPDTKPEDIPESVWDDVGNGAKLVDAYTRYENQLLKDQLSQLKEGKDIEQQNEENAASSTGSVTGKGETKPARFTRAQVEKMTEAEVNKNWKAIQESMKTWE